MGAVFTGGEKAKSDGFLMRTCQIVYCSLIDEHNSLNSGLVPQTKLEYHEGAGSGTRELLFHLDVSL